MPRDGRLKRQRLIRPLFDPAAPGSSPGQAGRLSVGIIQVRWAVVPRLATGADTPLQVGFAPGRRSRTKVGRNRVRRVLRETWRTHQAPLLQRFATRPDETLTVFALFRGNEDRAPEEIRRDLPRALARLDEQLVDGPPDIA
jgi:ribonuclease P protein component